MPCLGSRERGHGPVEAGTSDAEERVEPRPAVFASDVGASVKFSRATGAGDLGFYCFFGFSFLFFGENFGNGKNESCGTASTVD